MSLSYFPFFFLIVLKLIPSIYLALSSSLLILSSSTSNLLR